MIPVGESVQIIGYLDKRSLHSRVLGWVEGEYLVVSFPTSSNGGGEEVNFPKDAALMCRGMIDGKMHGFKTHVLHSVSQPAKYLFLLYPNQMEDMSGQKGFRLDIDIPATAVLASEGVAVPPESGEEYSVTIRNLSAGSAIIRMPEKGRWNDFEVVFLTFSLPDGTSVERLRANIQKDIAFQDPASFGVEFKMEEPEFEPVFDFLLLANKIISQSGS